jgi:hypothetical protein
MHVVQTLSSFPKVSKQLVRWDPLAAATTKRIVREFGDNTEIAVAPPFGEYLDRMGEILTVKPDHGL